MHPAPWHRYHGSLSDSSVNRNSSDIDSDLSNIFKKTDVHLLENMLKKNKTKKSLGDKLKLKVEDMGQKPDNVTPEEVQ